MDENDLNESENVLNSEADEEINPNDSDDGKRFDNHSDEAGFITGSDYAIDGGFIKLNGK